MNPTVPPNAWKLVDQASETIRLRGREFLSDQEESLIWKLGLETVVNAAVQRGGVDKLDWGYRPDHRI